jgi:plasmid stabilization system protein ParE
MARAHLTRRALLELEEIDRYGVDRWGERVARQYFDELTTAVSRLEASPSLLRERPEYSLWLRFYAAREHVFVCDVIEDEIYVLGVWHGRMDFAGRLDLLEPQLVLEAELLHARIARKGEDQRDQ